MRRPLVAARPRRRSRAPGFVVVYSAQEASSFCVSSFVLHSKPVLRNPACASLLQSILVRVQVPVSCSSTQDVRVFAAGNRRLAVLIYCTLKGQRFGLGRGAAPDFGETCYGIMHMIHLLLPRDRRLGRSCGAHAFCPWLEGGQELAKKKVTLESSKTKQRCLAARSCPARAQGAPDRARVFKTRNAWRVLAPEPGPRP